MSLHISLHVFYISINYAEHIIFVSNLLHDVIIYYVHITTYFTDNSVLIIIIGKVSSFHHQNEKSKDTKRLINKNKRI